MAMRTEDQSQTASRPTWFEIPAPVKRIFDRYPLVTYAANELPLRAPKSRKRHVLHVFTTEEDARTGRPSFNPSCLKWQDEQTYLKIAGVAFTTKPSNNHASPSGSLPFLVPAESQTAVASAQLRKWSRTAPAATVVDEPDAIRYEAYASLLESSVRKAWLYQLYLNPSNRALLHSLYIAPSSTNPLVQATLAYSLQHAAATELVKASGTTTLVESETLRDAQQAFSALAELLGEGAWFFGHATPSLFDASVFAYTFLILDNGRAWRENPLRQELETFGNLVEHARRIERMYFADSS
nr:metaxin-1 [Quercus suber]